MKKLHSKLDSRRGASISFALLLFLVCAVFGAIMLRAASAAVGRMSRAAEMDQRYYSVTSAAALLRDTLDGQSAVLTDVTTTETTVHYNAAGEKTSTDGPTETKEPTVPDATKNKILTDAAQLCADDWGADETQRTRTLDVEISIPSTEGEDKAASAAKVKAALELTVAETLKQDGTLILDVSKGGESGSSTEKYTLRLTFALEQSKSTDTKTVTGTPIYQSGRTGYDITTTTTEKVTTTYLWRLVDIAPVGGG